MADVDHREVKRQWARWLLTPETDRVGLHMARSQAEFARSHRVSARTLRSWQAGDNDEFNAIWQSLGGDPDAVGVTPEPEVGDDGASEAARSEEESTYLRVKRAITAKAMSGDQKALDAYMKHWGGEFADQERQERETGFADLEDDALIAETLSTIGVDRVRGWLEGLPGG